MKNLSYTKICTEKNLSSDGFCPENNTELKAESVAVSNLHRKHKMCAFKPELVQILVRIGLQFSYRIYSHKPWLLKPKPLNPDQYQALPELMLWRHFQFLVSDLCPCHQLANFFRLNRLCCLKTNAHVRSSCYAVILNVSLGVFPIFELN